MFKEKYKKFKKSVKEFEIIPKETKKIVIGMSGGKDAAVMAHFILEYQKHERPDIELEMFTAPVPHWEQIPEKLFNTPLSDQQKDLLIKQKTVMDNFNAYWEKLFNCKTITVEQNLYEDRILKMNWGCMLCFGTKMKAFHKYFLEQPYENNTLFAFGWTKWDAHYTLLSHFLKSNGLKWHEVKKENPQKYKSDCVFLASFLAYPKVNLGIPGKDIYRINPIVEFDDSETYDLTKELKIPVIVDICKELYGDIFDQDRRYLSKYLSIYSGNQKLLNLSENSFLYDYRNLLNFLKKTEILPPIEEINGLMYNAYNSNFDELFELLQKDILLIGDTFVFNFKENKNQSNNSEDEILQKVGFADSFIKALKDDFNQNKLADIIINLLNESTNPAVLHLSSILEEKLFSSDIINCSLKHRDQLIYFLKNIKYKVIGISTTFTIDKSYIINLINLIKEYAPKSKIILGGMFIIKLFKTQKGEWLQKNLSILNADYYVFNEIGEYSLIDILNYEKCSNPDIRQILNIAYKLKDEFKINPYQQNNINTSISNWVLAKNTTYAFIRASVSCLFKCKFCDFPVIADRYRSKSIEIINREFKNIKNAGIKYIRFLDDTFNLPKKHFNNILTELISNEYNFEWVAYIRCQYLDKATVNLMKKSGCIGVFLGLESGNNMILKNMNKCATKEQYIKGIAYLNKYEIPTYGAFIIGFPGENDETIEDTINFIKQVELQYYRLFTWIYGYLAPVAQEKEKYSIEIYADNNWKHATMTSKEALEKCKLIMKEIKTSVHCTIPFDYTFYLNRNNETKNVFNDSLRHFNERNK